MNRRRQRHRARMHARYQRQRRRIGSPPRTYRVISFSAPTALCDFLDQTTALLREEGFRHASRSFVVQTAIDGLGPIVDVSRSELKNLIFENRRTKATLPS